MNTSILDNIMVETREDEESQSKRMIPASEVQPGQWIWHIGWSATCGWYEVVRTVLCPNGVTLLYIQSVSIHGKAFEMGLGYWVGQVVEVAER